ncbi:MAG: UDP-4-amino-4,6-dideoxy-N-acetyl-beta-L-altrosamine transaminase [Silvibacterium sp.]
MSTAKRSYPPLAIHGGRPVRAKFLPYGRQMVEEEDIAAVVDVLRSDWLTTGPKVKEFEEALASSVGARYGVVFSSGTAALHAAAYAAGLGPGDEAITTSLTFAATANCVLYNCAIPIFADVCSDTLNIDPEQVRQLISAKTKAIFPVDYAGHPADMAALMDIASERGLIVIEDAAHSLGAVYNHRPVGSLAHMTMFSFHPVKHITTGEGGMVVTNHEEFAHRLRLFRSHGIDSDALERRIAGQWYYEMIDLGYNYRLPDINCALGLSQLRRLDENLARRREVATRYDKAFRENDSILTPRVRPLIEPAWHLYPVRVAEGLSRAEVFRALRAENVGVNVHYIPVHLHPYYRRRFGYQNGTCPVAEKAYSQLISLPMFHAMSDADVNDVIEAVDKVTEGLRANAN